MATNTYWGYSSWSSVNWGGIASDITVLVGGTNDGTWGVSTWGNGVWGTITPDPNLQLTLSTPPVQAGWGLNSWGEYSWGGGEPIVVKASATELTFEI